MKLQAVRLAANLKQSEVLERIGAINPPLDVGLLSKYEHGICIPSMRHLDALAKAYGVALASLLDASDARYALIILSSALRAQMGAEKAASDAPTPKAVNE